MGMHDIYTKVADGLEAIAGFTNLTDSFDQAGTSTPENIAGLGQGGFVACRMQVHTAYTGGDATSRVVPILIGSPNAGLAGGGERYLMTIGGGSTVGEAITGFVGLVLSDLSVGAEFVYPVPSQTIFGAGGNPQAPFLTEQRYLGVLFVVTGTAFATGKWTVHFGAYQGPTVPRRRATGITRSFTPGL